MHYQHTLLENTINIQNNATKRPFQFLENKLHILGIQLHKIKILHKDSLDIFQLQIKKRLKIKLLNIINV